MSKRHFNKTEAKRYIEGQSIKYALDKLAPMTTQDELENNVAASTPHPNWKPQPPPNPERARILNLIEQLIDLLRDMG